VDGIVGYEGGARGAWFKDPGCNILGISQGTLQAFDTRT
jgi:hypothetical protein